MNNEKPSYTSTVNSTLTTCSQITRNSRNSCDCNISYEERERKIRNIVRIKLFLVIFTLLGGAILAITINMWGKSSVPKRTEPEIKDVILVDEYDPQVQDLGQFRNDKFPGICLDDQTKSEEAGEYAGGSIIGKPCKSNAYSQFFAVDKKNGNIRKKKTKYCIDTTIVIIKRFKVKRQYARGGGATAETRVRVKPCDEKEYAAQSWQWKDENKIFNSERKQCLEMMENLNIIPTECTENTKSQVWKFDPINMAKKLYSRQIEPRIQENNDIMANNQEF